MPNLIPIYLLAAGVAFIVETTSRDSANVKDPYMRVATGVLMTAGGFVWLWFWAIHGPALVVLAIATLVLGVGEGLRMASRKNRKK